MNKVDWWKKLIDKESQLMKRVDWQWKLIVVKLQTGGQSYLLRHYLDWKNIQILEMFDIITLTGQWSWDLQHLSSLQLGPKFL